MVSHGVRDSGRVFVNGSSGAHGKTLRAGLGAWRTGERAKLGRARGGVGHRGGRVMGRREHDAGITAKRLTTYNSAGSKVSVRGTRNVASRLPASLPPSLTVIVDSLLYLPPALPS